MIREVRIRICWLLVITPIFGKIGNTHSSQSYKRATIINYNSIESYYQHFYSSYHVRIAIYDGRTFKTLFTHFKALPKLLVDQRIEIQNVRKTFFRVLPVCSVWGGLWNPSQLDSLVGHWNVQQAGKDQFTKPNRTCNWTNV